MSVFIYIIYAIHRFLLLLAMIWFFYRRDTEVQRTQREEEFLITAFLGFVDGIFA